MYIQSSCCILVAAFATMAFGFEYRFDDTVRSEAETKTTAANVQPRLRAAQSLNSDDAYCLVFEDHFNTFDLKNWQHEISLSGGMFAFICSAHNPCFCYIQHLLKRRKLGVPILCQ